MFIQIFSPSAEFQTFLKNADSFLGTHVRDGRVAYATIKSDPGQIQALYTYIGMADISDLSENEKKAFYINAYNLIVIYQVSTYYPLKSPLDASGFFDKVKHQVAGESMTLNSLEIKYLTQKYNDPRIHFALACAAISCPKLASFAYMPDKLDTQLEVRTRQAINDPEWLIVDQKNKTLRISKIFQWYKKDFEIGYPSVTAFINAYRKQPVSSDYSVEFYEYNWGLNQK
jgi:hypothetical protein